MKLLRTPFVSALLGGLLVAIAFLLVDAGRHDQTKTVVEATPIAQPASNRAEKGLTVNDIYKRDAPGVVFVRAQIVRRQPASPFDPFPQEQRGEATGSG